MSDLLNFIIYIYISNNLNKKKDSHKLNYGENNPFDAIRDALAEREKREKTPFLSEEALLSVFKSIFSVSYHRLQNIKKKNCQSEDA